MGPRGVMRRSLRLPVCRQTWAETVTRLETTTHGSELNFLRSAPAKLVLDAGYRNTAPGPNGSPTQGSWLAVDGWVIPEQPALTLRSGRVARVPVIIGSNVQEFSSTAATALTPEELRK